MCTINGVEQSTYMTSYRGEMPSLPLIKYKNLPSVFVNLSTESDKSYMVVPLTRAKRPVLQPCKVAKEQVISLAPVRPKSSKKHDTKPKKVFNTKFGPMDSATIDALYRKRRYSTSSQDGAKEFALPVSQPDPPTTTQEPKADMVRLRGQRYEETPDPWQDAVLWDRIQSRSATQPCCGSSVDKTLPSRSKAYPASGDTKLLNKRGVETTIEPAKQEQIISLVRNDGLANVFVRKCPGYAGYIPLCPPETRLDDKKSPRAKTSLMKSSYSKFPDKIYKPPSRAKKSQFSRAVTLTYPVNPYNKIGEEKVKVDRESRYLDVTDYQSILHS